MRFCVSFVSDFALAAAQKEKPPPAGGSRAGGGGRLKKAKKGEKTLKKRDPGAYDRPAGSRGRLRTTLHMARSTEEAMTAAFSARVRARSPVRI